MSARASTAGTILARLSLAALLLFARPAHAQGAEGRRYSPGAFDSIAISGSATVRLVQGRDDSVFVAGGDDAQDAVSIDVDDGQLRVRPGGAWKFWRSKELQLTITARDLKQLQISGAADVTAPDALHLRQLLVRISGAGNVRLDKLKAERLEFTVSGLGTGQMSGAVDELAVRISGRGSYLGENLAAQQASIIVSGSGDVKVWAIKALTASVSGVATVDFWGPAKVTRSNSGLTSWNDRGDKRGPP